MAAPGPCTLLLEGTSSFQYGRTEGRLDLHANGACATSALTPRRASQATAPHAQHVTSSPTSTHFARWGRDAVSQRAGSRRA
jgi:hypothetical protein